MNKVLGVFLGLIGILILGCVGVLVVSELGPFEGKNPLSAFVEDARNSAVNVAIDASGAKGAVREALQSRRGDIAAATGMSEAQVDAAIDNLAIENWQAATLPTEAEPINSFSGSAYGVEGTVTTYDDPGYVTVEAYGQSVTLAVPESAQAYLPYLSYIQ